MLRQQWCQPASIARSHTQTPGTHAGCLCFALRSPISQNIGGMETLPLHVWQYARGERPQPLHIIQVEPLQHQFFGPRLFIGVDLLENHVGRPGNCNFAGFQRFDEALKGFASESRCLSKLALKLAPIACEKQAQHHASPDITRLYAAIDRASPSVSGTYQVSES